MTARTLPAPGVDVEPVDPQATAALIRKIVDAAVPLSRRQLGRLAELLPSGPLGGPADGP